MSNKEVNLRSILFLVIGILLLLSLIICIYIVHNENDLVKVTALVVDVKKDSDGTGKNDVTVDYDVDNTTYRYNFYYRDEVNVGDEIEVFYHEDNVTSVQVYKTSKFIFVCPLIGLALCVLGLFELFKKNKDEDDAEDFKTQVISVVGNTEQLEIITDDNDESIKYEKIPEEKEEAEVKAISGKKDNILEDKIIKDNKVKESEKVDVKNKDVVENENKILKILPSYYYVTNTSLVYEEKGKETKEIDFKDVKDIIKTINSVNKVVKIVVLTDQVRCVLTKMKDIDLEETANLLHNRMLQVDEDFQEDVEYKEY